MASDAPAAAPTKSNSRCEVLIVGGGPAGSTLATLLARKGRDVVLLEKSQHPRFHIGESLLPANAPLFDELGVRADIERIGMPKYGVEFVSPTHDRVGRAEFSEAWDKSMPYAWQVRRDAMDELLFRHAQQSGARALENHRVRDVQFDDDGATAQVEGPDGVRTTWRTRYLVDATGRDTLLANQLKCKEKNSRHASSALFGHFRGAQRLPGRMEGNISIFWFAHGWFWFIPLADGTTSIGAVCWPYYLKSRRKPLPEFFRDTIAMAPQLAERLQGAELIDDVVHATGNYSYTATHATGARYAMLGDAYAFIDPVFSSGVYLAMKSAFESVALIETTLDRPADAAAERKRFERLMKFGPREFSWFIFRVTNPTMRDVFMEEAAPVKMKAALMSLLAGDIYGSTPIWPSLRLLKAYYYLVSLRHAGRTVRAWLARRRNIRDVDVAAT